jgi:hypothetical protein
LYVQESIDPQYPGVTVIVLPTTGAPLKVALPAVSAYAISDFNGTAMLITASITTKAIRNFDTIKPPITNLMHGS